MLAVAAGHSGNNRRKLNVEPGGRGRVDEDQHFLFVAGDRGRQVTFVQDLFEPRSIVLAVFETAQLAVQFNPIMQDSGVKSARLAHEALLNQAVKTRSAQPNGC